ncbi:MAG: N-6 DNA methylase [Gammaproteobacteria bacterium]|nr:N-6 DNA methylase [Gammaproteobacteria bacterium]
MTVDFIKTYLKQIADTLARGDAREESFYPYLKTLLENLGGSGCKVTVLPKKTEAGNPDFRVWDGKQHICGYIEAKTPGSNLDQNESSEQLKRYRETFPNLMLTDFFEFRLYRQGQMIRKTFIGRPFIAGRLKQTPPLENADEFSGLLEQFFSFSLPRSFSAESLAVELAKRTRFLRDEVIAQELREEAAGKGELHGFFSAFKKYLLPNINETDFADLYSQTLSYGMFAARSRSSEDFSRATAYQSIPPTIGILRDVFRFISLGDLSAQMQVIVDDIADVLAAADLERILQTFSAAGKGQDPIMHFYETFLSAYDPKLREKRGVYYTPEPVADYIVRCVHELLKTRFALKDGLADPAVTLLDPAAGTLTFPVQAIRNAVGEFTQKYGKGGQHKLIKNQILKNFYAFELMMAPYAIGHLKMGYLLEELDCPLDDDERFKLYLTNTLSMEDFYLSDVPGLSSLSEESHEAAEIKKKPILVILGNPPYSGISANKNEWTELLIKNEMDGAQSFYTVDGKPLDEKNPKWLQDDYVKFLRFAQWKVQRAGQGIVGMITNHGYLDNPTFRGMRQSLTKTFNQIFILNLHGSALKRELTPEGGKDENVFDIRPGVAIIFMVKKEGKKGCIVKQTDLYGTREEKYKWLNNHDLKNSGFEDADTRTPWYFFTKGSEKDFSEYESWPRIDDIFQKNSVGIVTGRDKLTIHFNDNELWNTILSFSQLDPEIARQAYGLGNDSQEWKVTQAQLDLKESNFTKEKITPIHYRPFDVRSTYYTGKSKGFICRSRGEVMNHMINHKNYALVTVRQVKSGENWQHILISDGIVESCYISNKTSEICYIFPIYIYPVKNDLELGFDDNIFRKPNISTKIIEKLKHFDNKTLTPENIFFYIYALLFSNTYRKNYNDALRYDFPRVPLTKNQLLFSKLAKLGRSLGEIHLLKSNELDPPTFKYQGHGSNDRIEKIEYDEDKYRVYINTEKYFEGITQEVWSYQIGGYKVLMKYLKDRMGRIMDNPRHYTQIVTALSKTIVIQKKIDEIYPEIEKDLIEL